MRATEEGNRVKPSSSARRRRSWELDTRAHKLEARGDEAGARGLARMALLLNAREPTLWSNLGVLESNCGHETEAVRAFKVAARLALRAAEQETATVAPDILATIAIGVSSIDADGGDEAAKAAVPLIVLALWRNHARRLGRLP